MRLFHLDALSSTRGSRAVNQLRRLGGTGSRCLPTETITFLFALHLVPAPSKISDQPSKLAAAPRCKTKANCECLSGRHSEARELAEGCRLPPLQSHSKQSRGQATMPYTDLCPASNATWTPAMDEGPATRVRLFHSARCLQTVCLSSYHSQEQRAIKGCLLPLCFAPEPSTRDLLRPIEQCLRLLFGARRMQTVCVIGRHSKEVLAITGCRLPCSSLLCTRAVTDLRPVEQACGCSSVPGGCKLFACLASTRRSCLPTNAAAFLFALHRSRQGSPPYDQSSSVCGCSSV